MLTGKMAGNVSVTRFFEVAVAGAPNESGITGWGVPPNGLAICNNRLQGSAPAPAPLLNLFTTAIAPTMPASSAAFSALAAFAAFATVLVSRAAPSVRFRGSDLSLRTGHERRGFRQ